MNKNAPRDGGETDTSAILVFVDDDDGTREEDIAVALATAANCCVRLNANLLSQVRPSFRNLVSLVSNSDDSVAESACLALHRVLTSSSCQGDYVASLIDLGILEALSEFVRTSDTHHKDAA